jgi:hypothetical protein
MRTEFRCKKRPPDEIGIRILGLSRYSPDFQIQSSRAEERLSEG